MINVYIYALDTLADWELGYVTSELNSGQYFKKSSANVSVKTVGVTRDAIATKGGMRVIPEVTTNEIISAPTTVLLLPGADTWDDPKHIPIIKKATELLECGATVAAICGATTVLAEAGLFDKRIHTSNSLDYLKMVSPNYKGEPYYRNVKAISDQNLITASSAGALLFAHIILAKLDVFSEGTLEAWYNYFNTGDSKYFYDLMQTLTPKLK
ncbi:Putative intracellular protease/amidase [Halobacillus karajensis]|uniref:DJ-1/PfpI family protein n=1 Tax=Halobacillus karajensis TaxID=195088 RepID=UPI0008A7C130|nr:DJ-1/PfpI family protein [Halobacillus karajensis]SEH76973.1 Putative intracellular protease/amidase [Halobacillus karajensis]